MLSVPLHHIPLPSMTRRSMALLALGNDLLMRIEDWVREPVTWERVSRAFRAPRWLLPPTDNIKERELLPASGRSRPL